MLPDAREILRGESTARPHTQIAARGVKPLLRGFPDVLATALAAPAAALMIAHAAAGAARVSATIYSLSLVLLFAVSATYHTPWWPTDVRKIWRRLDHATIYVLIAGTYTPITLLVIEPPGGWSLLGVVWGAAFFGLCKSFFWPTSPRWLNTVIYVAVGWAVVPYLGEVYAGLSSLAFVLIIAGGVIYTIGSLIYVHRWPNPWPVLLGYHEIFHVFVIAAAACHFAAIWTVVVP